MGQYYKPYLRGRYGAERKFNPQNAIFRTVHAIDGELELNDPRKKWDMNCETSYGYLFSGLKLMEHSWLENDFVNGVLEAIWDNPCQVAWVGDYADDPSDFNWRYTQGAYEAVWGNESLPDGRFDAMPSAHRDGYLVNVTRGQYIDLAEYAEAATYKPKWSKEGGWCIHPLPLLTAIGNGRGGGDYHGAHMELVGLWAMDEIAYTQNAAKVEWLERLRGGWFREED